MSIRQEGERWHVLDPGDVILFAERLWVVWKRNSKTYTFRPVVMPGGGPYVVDGAAKRFAVQRVDQEHYYYETDKRLLRTA